MARRPLNLALAILRGGRRGLASHLRWLRRGLRSGQARLVAVYLVFLAGLGGWALGSLSHGEESGPYSFRHPPPVTAPPPGTRWVEVKATAYCPCAKCCGKHADGFTAINRAVTDHPYGIAVAKELIPMRTWLDVPGYGEAMVDDVGGAMRQSARRGIVHLDLRFKTHRRAREWGVQWHWIAMPEDIPAARRGLGREELLAYHGRIDAFDDD